MDRGGKKGSGKKERRTTGKKNTGKTCCEHLKTAWQTRAQKEPGERELKDPPRQRHDIRGRLKSAGEGGCPKRVCFCCL